MLLKQTEKLLLFVAAFFVSFMFKSDYFDGI